MEVKGTVTGSTFFRQFTVAKRYAMFFAQARGQLEIWRQTTCLARMAAWRKTRRVNSLKPNIAMFDKVCQYQSRFNLYRLASSQNR